MQASGAAKLTHPHRQLTMRYVEEINADEEGEDLEEQAGLIDDVDAMLEEDDGRRSPSSSDDATTPRPSTSPAISLQRLGSNPTISRTSPSPKLATASLPALQQLPYRDSVESVRKSGRPSEDWEGAFSDFDDQDSRDAEVEDEDPLGLGLSTPAAVSMDKRRD